ncbi:MAG: GMC family oxidoreductase, partial [Gemmatimonadota bacterium]
QTNPERQFHKQVAFTDFYHGGPNGDRPAGPWGMIQSLQVPPPDFIKTAPFPVNLIGPRTYHYNIFLMCIAEDVPQFDNRVTLHPTRRDRYGQPIAQVRYTHHPDDLERRRALYRQAKRLVRKAGAWAWVQMPVSTFSHASGTCRAGTDPTQSVLDPHCRFFGLPNLFVVDAGFMPTVGAVNPSLTIAANGLRVGQRIADRWDEVTGPSRD